ncbi:MAG: prefoldin subunit [archaeon]|jgi:prefoldin beta subunit
MDEGEQRAMILEFEKNRQMLGNVNAQKQQVTYQLEMVDASLEELAKTKEKTVFKVVGNVLFPKDAKEMEKELKDKKESTDLRLKTLAKQEEVLLKKLNTARAKLEAQMKGAKSEDADESEEKNEKKRK